MHCIASLAVGGVETIVLDTLDYFKAHGGRHEHVLCAFRGGELETSRLAGLRAAGFDCHVLHRASRFGSAFRRALRETVDRVQPDIIHAYNPTAALWTRWCLGRRQGLRIVVHCGGVLGKGRLWPTIERLLQPRTAMYVFNSHSTRRVWETYFDIKRPSLVIHNGVDLSDPPNTDGAAALPESPFVLLTVCRIVPIKSLATQIQAVKILHDRGQTDVRLMIVGDGPWRARVEAEARQADVCHTISFEGYQSRPRDYYHRAHVYLSTSYNETFGLTLTDAMWHGLTCIAASAGGPSEIIEDGKSGFLITCTEPVPQELQRGLPRGQELPTVVYDHGSGMLRPPLGVSPVALADCIADVRSRWGELKAMRDAARDRIVSRFGMDRYCRELENLYDELR